MTRRILVLALLSGGALAQGAEPLTLNLVMSLVRNVTVDGKVTEQTVENPGSVFPGDVLRQVVTVRNNTGRAIQNVPVRLPVPRSTTYLAAEQGVNVARTEYSVDGGKTFAPAPLMKTVTVTENGKSVRRQVEVKPSEYTAVRWVLSALPAGHSVKLGYRVQVR
ncbi:hypothetical protein HNQ07_001573 [Deinococcus metalli]|uniref:DUF11 domain-containing protein n=1 Tax=Deinococcus metalli TaxID=1141878 RepID=A0A7W8NNT7_9DEIO|nr:hypothetical protein [Deinococcus metalli]MBB5376116.1 hypothetical protein [Deinococcus metalli]GHF40681.1 hypothetical protein GCM10017781_16670 [Deinococcus metalli]